MEQIGNESTSIKKSSNEVFGSEMYWDTFGNFEYVEIHLKISRYIWQSSDTFRYT